MNPTPWITNPTYWRVCAAVARWARRAGLVAALSLAGVGPDRTRIKIYAVPGLGRNQHRVTIEGEFGRLVVELENVPSENPKTGKLSYLSTIALLRQLGASLVVGT